MTDFNIEINPEPSFLLEITSTSGASATTVEAIVLGGNTIEISNRDKILPSDFPDTYPISWTTGLLPIERVSGLSITGTSGISVSQSGGSYVVYTTGTFGLTSSQIQSLLNSGVSINVISGTGNFNSLFVNNTSVSTSGHSHVSSSITDFNSAVSGLLPVKNVAGSGYVIVVSDTGNYTISVTGLQPTGNYSLVGHSHTSSDITDFNSTTSGLLAPYALLTSGNFGNLFVSGIPVSLSGHTHAASNIVDFNSSVSGLLPSVSGSGYATVVFSNNVYTVGITGLQPSGNYSISGHQHTVSDITNFNTGVSGLLIPYALLSSGNFSNLYVTGIPVSLSGHTHTSSQIIDFNSAVSGILPVKNINGSGYVIVSSSGETFIVGVTGLQPVGNYSLVGHTHSVSDITNFNTGVSGLLPSVSGSGYATVGFSNNIYTVSVTGLQPSGNYSVSGHTHTASNITDFNSSVSGLLPVTNIVGISGIGISVSGTQFTIFNNRTESNSVNNFGLNRLLVSDGTSSGIVGLSQLLYQNNTFSVSGSISGINQTPIHNCIINGGTP